MYDASGGRLGRSGTALVPASLLTLAQPLALPQHPALILTCDFPYHLNPIADPRSLMDLSLD